MIRLLAAAGLFMSGCVYVGEGGTSTASTVEVTITFPITVSGNTVPFTP